MLRRCFQPAPTGALILTLVALTLDYARMSSPSANALFAPPSLQPDETAAPVYFSGFVNRGDTRIVHAPSVVELDQGRLRAFWFAGSREGARDVVIRSAVFNPVERVWSLPVTALTRESVQRDTHRYIRKLGNPVVTRDAGGRLWLFFVSVSIGGWSCSAVNVSVSDDQGLSWSPVQRLISSPFLNISTLVKTVPFFYGDGSIGLPVYHELFDKFGEILRIDSAARVIDKIRINARFRTLQPLVLVESERDALVLMRYAGEARPRRAIQARTRDSGNHWSPAVRSPLPNPDSAIGGTREADGSILLALNNNELLRDDLTLVRSEDNGKSWHEIVRLEDESRYRQHDFADGEYISGLKRLLGLTAPGRDLPDAVLARIEAVMCDGHPCWYQFDYPYMIRTHDGMFHLLYTWNRSLIKHVGFNQVWVQSMIHSQSPQN